jgi:hypothetical protein
MAVDGTITPTAPGPRNAPGTYLRMTTFSGKKQLVEIIEDKGYSLEYRIVRWYERVWRWLRRSVGKEAGK